jgi:MSHA biogenesis protein MshO
MNARHASLLQEYSRRPFRCSGFSMIELIVAIVITGIVVGLMSMFIAAPMQSYLGQARRSMLQDSADNILRAMNDDIRPALPNSARITPAGTTLAIDVIRVVATSRYYSVSTPPGNAAQELSFYAADTNFTTTGEFDQPANVPATTHQLSLVVGNRNLPGGPSAYALTGVITPPGAQINFAAPLNDERAITIPAGVTFTSPSAQRRLFLVAGPITYLCDLAAGTLTKYVGHPIDPVPLTTDAQLTGAGATRSLIATSLIACDAKASDGDLMRGGLVTVHITLSNTGETIQLLQQIPIEAAA